MNIGIYVITNKSNGKFYGGSSVHIEERWRQHKRSAKTNSSYPIHAAIRKYGEHNFDFEVIQECSEQDLLKLEQLWLDEHCRDSLCYNVARDASAPMRGKNHSDFTKNQISKAKKENYKSLSLRHAVGVSWRGKVQPAEMVTKRVGKIRGRKYSVEHRQALSEGAKRRYNIGGKSYPSLINDDGRCVEAGTNIRRLAGTINVNVSGLCNVVNGKQKQTAGWRIAR